MFPVFDLEGIEKDLRARNHRRAVLLLLVKPSDSLSGELISNFNYYHHDSADACSIYAPGYSEGHFVERYDDAKEVCLVAGKDWWYSDQCFVKFKNELEKRIKWRYSGEPEVFVLQSKTDSNSSVLDFSNYVVIDLCQGIRRGYIESASRLMESLITASKSEVDSKEILKNATRLSPKDIAHSALDELLDKSHCPTPLKKIIEDKAFYRSANHKGW